MVSSRSVTSLSEASLCSLVAVMKIRHFRRAPTKPMKHARSSPQVKVEIATLRVSDPISTSSREKKVRFARRGRYVRIPSHNSMSADEKKQIWYTAIERSTMRQDARSTAVNTATLNPQSSEKLRRGFTNARFLANTREANDIEKLLNNRELLVKKFKASFDWCGADDDSCRGLEGWFSPLLRYEREEVAKDSRIMVIETSREASRIGNGHLGPEGIAWQYAEMTRLSVILARVFAEIDTVAAA